MSLIVNQNPRLRNEPQAQAEAWQSELYLVQGCDLGLAFADLRAVMPACRLGLVVDGDGLGVSGLDSRV